MFKLLHLMFDAVLSGLEAVYLSGLEAFKRLFLTGYYLKSYLILSHLFPIKADKIYLDVGSSYLISS